MKDKNVFWNLLRYTIVLPPLHQTYLPVGSYESRNAQLHSQNFICKNKFIRRCPSTISFHIRVVDVDG